MIVNAYPCPQCNFPVAAVSGTWVVCPICTHGWTVRPSSLDVVWFGRRHPDEINPLAIYLRLETWLGRCWAEAVDAEAVHMEMMARPSPIPESGWYAEAFRDVVRLRVRCTRQLSEPVIVR